LRRPEGEVDQLSVHLNRSPPSLVDPTGNKGITTQPTRGIVNQDVTWPKALSRNRRATGQTVRLEGQRRSQQPAHLPLEWKRRLLLLKPSASRYRSMVSPSCPVRGPACMPRQQPCRRWPSVRPWLLRSHCWRRSRLPHGPRVQCTEALGQWLGGSTTPSSRRTGTPNVARSYAPPMMLTTEAMNLGIASGSPALRWVQLPIDKLLNRASWAAIRRAFAAWSSVGPEFRPSVFSARGASVKSSTSTSR